MPNVQHLRTHDRLSETATATAYARVARAAMKDNLLRTSLRALFPASDEQAMERVRLSDDPHAFAQLVRRWETPIQRLCTRMLGDPHRGEDVAQETFARLFAKRREYQVSGRFSTFLWRMALNLCYDQLRRAKRRPEGPLYLDGDGEASEGLLTDFDSADQQLLRREESELVRRAVMQLPEGYRSVVVLRHFQNLKFREIADVLGIPEGTVKSRMAEALTQLHRSLAPAFDAARPAGSLSPKPVEELFVL